MAWIQFTKICTFHVVFAVQHINLIMSDKRSGLNKDCFQTVVVTVKPDFISDHTKFDFTVEIYHPQCKMLK